MRKFDITRQAVFQHISRLVRDGHLSRSGSRTRKLYSLEATITKFASITLKGTSEDRVWRDWAVREIAAVPAPGISDNIHEISHYGFTEMLNNAIEHSEGDVAEVTLSVTASTLQMTIEDNGIGIFRKVSRELELADEREALLELSKGKFTTDRSRHSGEGIFFTSRMFDFFEIESRGLLFQHTPDDDWLFEAEHLTPDVPTCQGTRVSMTIFRDSKRSPSETFDRFTSEAEDNAFSKTHVPLSLAQYDNESLVSRSQARRVLARFNRFKEAILDFKNVPRIGQAFADEIFRVHALEHRDFRIIAVNANVAVDKMIRHARANLQEDLESSQ